MHRTSIEDFHAKVLIEKGLLIIGKNEIVIEKGTVYPDETLKSVRILKELGYKVTSIGNYAEVCI